MLSKRGEVYAQWEVAWEEYRDAACHCREKICAAKTQLELKLPEMCGAIKKSVFSNILVAVGSVKVTSSCYRMRMITSQTGTWTKHRGLAHSLLPSEHRWWTRGFSVAWAVGPWLREWSAPKLTLELCGICWSSWIPTNLWSLMRFIQESSKTWL